MAGPHTMKKARRKAYTARTFRMTTEEFIKDMATRPVRREQTTLPNVIAIGGGVPLKVGNDVIGGGGPPPAPRGRPASWETGVRHREEEIAGRCPAHPNPPRARADGQVH